MYKFGPVKRKILLTLAGGLALGLSRDPRQYYRALRALRKDWSRINQQNFNRSIRRLSQEKLVEERILPDGSFKLVLTKIGKQQARKLSLLGNSIKFKKSDKWDGKWRIVVFDIPEKDRTFRGILREHLYVLDFYKLQNSVFVSPYPCEKPILELVDLYCCQRYVRVITATKIDNEKFLRKHFMI
jgi:DNA-binding transcriptional regulator PaaX